MFELCELEGNQRAARDPEWAALLARVRVGKWTERDVETLKGLVLAKREAPAEGAVHLYATRAQVANCNRSCIKDFAEAASKDIHDCPATDVVVNTGAPLPPEKAWLLSEDTGGLEALLRLAEGAEVMLRKNLDVGDGLANGARGKVLRVDLHSDGEVDKVWVEFEKGAGVKWQQAHQSAAGVAIRRTSTSFLDKDGNRAERRQFPLVLSKGTTIHKSQAATYHAGVHACLDKRVRQEGQAYVALSRSPTQSLCTLEKFDEESLRFNANAEWALTNLKLKLAKRGGPARAGLQDLWRQVIQPAEDVAHYEDRLKMTQPPNWKRYSEEQLALSAAEREEGGGSFACPRCGWVADSAAAYKKHKCPAKKAKAKPAPKPKQTAKPKVKTAAQPRLRAALAGPLSAAAPLPPPAAAPPAAAPPAPDLYFERQHRAHCGMHAVNNALGGKIFTPHHMKTAADYYLQELRGVDDAVGEHIHAGGWYSVQVLYTALFRKGHSLDFHAPVLTLEQARGATAFLQNWNNEHWVAYRRLPDGALCRLDSLQRAPEPVSEAALVASCAEHPTYAIDAPAEAHRAPGA